MKVVSRKEPAGPIAPAATIKIHAGHQFRDIYRFAADKDLTIIGGADPDVGIGGWMSGGGHGPLTALYGMGADQVVEMEVVTPDGELRTVNADQRPDLFWAIRGVSSSQPRALGQHIDESPGRRQRLRRHYILHYQSISSNLDHYHHSRIQHLCRLRRILVSCSKFSCRDASPW